jgi:uncharacterized membrane protein YbhN (UPF0104 family)
MTRRSDHAGNHPWWSRARNGIGLVVLVVVVARVGTGPFVDGLRRTDPVALVVATAITCFSAACAAWRWRLVAGSLGLHLDRRSALAAVLRSQFLNATLPGGILGDVDRALGGGRGLHGRGARSVVWERFLGQAVQIAMTVVLVALLPSALRPRGLAAAVALLCGVLGGGGVRRLARTRTTPVGTGPVGVVRTDLRRILGATGAARGIVLTSAAAVTGHLVVFVVAAHTAGVPVTSPALLSAVSLVLLASGLPLNVAGWGPREGAAAWAFTATGLGAGAGVTTAVVYGVMALVATAPGAVVVLLGRRPGPTAERAGLVLAEDARG